MAMAKATRYDKVRTMHLQGKRPSEIARELKITDGTVFYYLKKYKASVNEEREERQSIVPEKPKQKQAKQKETFRKTIHLVGNKQMDAEEKEEKRYAFSLIKNFAMLGLATMLEELIDPEILD